jgi:tRNA pseudouridine38-40 synthase
MHEAAQCLVGEHDFTSFRAIDCQSKSPFRYLEFVRVSRHGRLVVLDIKGNAFLHHMVRNISGVLMSIGAGRQPVDWCRQVLEARDRTQGGVTARPQGLYLTHVEYPAGFGVPCSPGAPAPIQSIFGASMDEREAFESCWRIARRPE